MLLSKLIENIPEINCTFDCEIYDIVSDSRQIGENSLFVCIKGARFDGHDVAADMLAKGAAAVVADHDLGLERQLIVTDTRWAMAVLCSAFFDRPQDKMRMIAVTGTKGKTTTANIMKQAVEYMGYKAGFVGTTGNDIGGLVLPARYTTPEPWEMEMVLSKMVKNGCTFCFMEASSQALHQKRLADMHYEIGIFNNLSRDHLDYHGNFENYLKAKEMLFDISDKAIINMDSPEGRQVSADISIPQTGYSITDENCDIYSRVIEKTIYSGKFEVCINGEKCECSINFPGDHSIYNATAAIGALVSIGFPLDKVCEAVSSVESVEGRCEVLHSGDGITVISDYAAIPDAIEKILSALRPFVTDGRLIGLFGVGGRRDTTKRQPTAEVMTRYCDYVVFSSDCPRDEDPYQLMMELKHYAEERNVPYTLLPDRYWAVKYMLTQLKPGDVFVLCCKGQENYQPVLGCTWYQDDRRIVRDYYKNLESKQ